MSEGPMRFAIIHAERQTFTVIEVADLEEALIVADLARGHIDFGMLWRSKDGIEALHHVVYEWGLRLPPERTHFSAIGSRLIAGNSVIFQTYAGETISLNPEWADRIRGLVRWFDSPADIERAITNGEVQRPLTAINDEVLWQWSASQSDQRPDSER